MSHLTNLTSIFHADTTSSGHGQHGDYLFGWKDDSLQRAMDAVLRDDYETECLNDRCSALEHQTVQQANACTKKTQVPNDVVGFGGECKLFWMLCGRSFGCIVCWGTGLITIHLLHAKNRARCASWE